MRGLVFIALLILAASPAYALDVAERSTSSPGTSPTWSPDGRLIVYQGSDYDIWVMLSDGSGKTRLTDDIYRDEQPVFSPDGSMLAYVSERNGLQELWVMESNGDGKRQLTASEGWKHSPTWSPDGTRIAYIVSPERNGKGEIWVTNLASGEARRLTKDGSIRSAAWNPKDGGLAYLSLRSGGYDIHVMDPSTGRDELLFEDTYWKGQLAWSADGERIAFSSYRDGNYDIWVLKVGKLERVTSKNSWQVSPAWSPDGMMIAYASDENGVYEIWVNGIDASPLPVIEERPAVVPAEVITQVANPVPEPSTEKFMERSLLEEKEPVLQLEEKIVSEPEKKEITDEIVAPARDYLPVIFAAVISVLIVELLSRANIRFVLNTRSTHSA